MYVLWDFVVLNRIGERRADFGQNLVIIVHLLKLIENLSYNKIQECYCTFINMILEHIFKVLEENKLVHLIRTHLPQDKSIPDSWHTFRRTCVLLDEL